MRDIALQQMGEHTEKQLAKTEARPRRTPGEKGCGWSPRKEELRKEAVKLFI